MRLPGLLAAMLLSACRREPAYSLWLPEGKTPRAALVLTPGGNGDGRRLTADPEWRAFASRHGLALVGCRRPTEEGLLDALAGFKLESAPLLLWGMSAGGQFNYEFAASRPERVLAFVVNKGGSYKSAHVGEKTRLLPGLLILGEKDLPRREAAIRGLLAANPGANWTLVVEPGVAHEEGKSAELSRKFFEKALQSAKR